MTTANILTDALDDLSEFLGTDDREMIERILNRLAQIELPSRYSDVITSARKARELYAELLSTVGGREGFEIHSRRGRSRLGSSRFGAGALGRPEPAEGDPLRAGMTGAAAPWIGR